MGTVIEPHQTIFTVENYTSTMKRRRVLTYTGAIVGAGLLPTTATGTGSDEHARPEAVRVEPTSEQRQSLAGSAESVDVAELEARARESPEKLSDEEVEQLLSAHEDHAACPLCQGFQPGW